MRDINSGLDASIRLLESLPIKDEKILGDLRTFQKSLKEIEKIYGAIPKSLTCPRDLGIKQAIALC